VGYSKRCSVFGRPSIGQNLIFSFFRVDEGVDRVGGRRFSDVFLLERNDFKQAID
jgi:hypothetical protein